MKKGPDSYSHRADVPARVLLNHLCRLAKSWAKQSQEQAELLKGRNRLATLKKALETPAVLQCLSMTAQQLAERFEAADSVLAAASADAVAAAAAALVGLGQWVDEGHGGSRDAAGSAQPLTIARLKEHLGQDPNVPVSKRSYALGTVNLITAAAGLQKGERDGKLVSDVLQAQVVQDFLQDQRDKGRTEATVADHMKLLLYITTLPQVQQQIGQEEVQLILAVLAAEGAEGCGGLQAASAGQQRTGMEHALPATEQQELGIQQPAATARVRAARAAAQAAERPTAAASDRRHGKLRDDLSAKAAAVFGSLTFAQFEEQYALGKAGARRSLRIPLLLNELKRTAAEASSSSDADTDADADAGTVAAAFRHLPDIVQSLHEQVQRWQESPVAGLSPDEARDQLKKLQGHLLSDKVHQQLSSPATDLAELNNYFESAAAGLLSQLQPKPAQAKAKKRRAASSSLSQDTATALLALRQEGGGLQGKRGKTSAAAAAAALLAASRDPRLHKPLPSGLSTGNGSASDHTLTHSHSSEGDINSSDGMDVGGMDQDAGAGVGAGALAGPRAAGAGAAGGRAAAAAADTPERVIPTSEADEEMADADQLQPTDPYLQQGEQQEDEFEENSSPPTAALDAAAAADDGLIGNSQGVVDREGLGQQGGHDRGRTPLQAEDERTAADVQQEPSANLVQAGQLQLGLAGLSVLPEPAAAADADADTDKQIAGAAEAPALDIAGRLRTLQQQRSAPAAAQDQLDAVLAASVAAAEAARQAQLQEQKARTEHFRRVLTAETALRAQVKVVAGSLDDKVSLQVQLGRLIDAIGQVPPGDLLADTFWCDVEYLLDVLPQDVPAEGPGHEAVAAAQQGWRELLRSVDAAERAAAAAAAGAGGLAAQAADVAAHQHQMDVVAAERYVRRSYGPLQLSLQQKVQFRAATQQLLELRPDDILVHRFRLIKESVKDLLPCPYPAQHEASVVQRQRHEAARLILDLTDTTSVTECIASHGEQHVRDILNVVSELRADFKLLNPSLPQQLSYLDKTPLQDMLSLAPGSITLRQLSEEWEWLTYLVRMPGIELQNSRNRLLNILTARFVSAEHVNPKFDDLLQAGDRLRLLFKALHPTPDQVVGLVALQKSCFLLQPGGPTGVHWVLDRFLWDVQDLMQLMTPDADEALPPQQLQEGSSILARLLGHDPGAAEPGNGHCADILAAGRTVRQLSQQLQLGFQQLGFSWWRLQLHVSALVQELLCLPAGHIRVARLKTDIKWLKTILSILEQHQEQLQEQQQAGPQPREQHAEALQLSVQISLATQTAFRALLTNSPSATATAAGAAPEGITQLIADEAALLDICQQLPDMPVQQKLSFLQQLQALLRMLFMLSTEDISNRIFHNRVQRLIQVPFADASEAYRLDNTLDAVLQQSDPATLLVPDAESAAAAVPAAMRHVEQLQLMLDPSAEQRQELQMASVVVGQGMPPRDVRIERFWNDYEWLLDVLQDPHTQPQHALDAISTLAMHITAQQAAAGDLPSCEAELVEQRLRQLCSMERNVRLLYPRLLPSLQRRMNFRELIEMVARPAALAGPDDLHMARLMHDYNNLLKAASDSSTSGDMRALDNQLVQPAFTRLLAHMVPEGV